MKVQYAPEVKQWSGDFPLVEEASDLLEKSIGTQSSEWNATLNRVQDRRGQIRYRLSLKDTTDEVFTDFAEEELSNQLHMKSRVNLTWVDLFLIRLDRAREESKRALSAYLAENGDREE